MVAIPNRQEAPQPRPEQWPRAAVRPAPPRAWEKKGAKAAPKKPAPKGSGSPSEPSGPGAGGASPPGH